MDWWWFVAGLVGVLLVALRVRSRVKKMDVGLRWNIERVDELTRLVGELKRELREVPRLATAVMPPSVVEASSEPAAPAPVPDAAPDDAAAPVASPLTAEAPAVVPPEPPVPQEPRVADASPVAAPSLSPPPPAEGALADGAALPPLPAPADETPPLAASTALPTAEALPEGTPPEPVSLPPIRLPAFNWESLVGVKLFSWVAGFALVIAAVLFLRYSIDAGWLRPPVRLAMGLLVGAGLLAGCELWGRRYAITANALDAAGIAILFASIFSASALWHLIPPLPTFALMALVTAAAVALSLRHDSIFVALLGLVGGFATPVMLSSGEDRPVGLFGYLLLLNVGLAWVAYRKNWSLLSALSVALTVLYEWGWFFKFAVYDRRDLPLAAGIFLVFPLFTAVASFVGHRPREPETPPPFGLPDMFEPTTVLSALVPLLLALCLAWSSQLGISPGILFGFLFLADVGLAVLAAARGPRILHVGSGVATVLVFVGWFSRWEALEAGEGWPSVLAWVALFVAFYLLAPVVAARLHRPLDGQARRASLTAPLLLLAFPALAWLEPNAASPALLFGVLLALGIAISTTAVLTEDGPLHFVGAFFAVAAEAVWSAKHLTPARLTDALVLYAVLGLFFLGVPVVARRYGKALEPRGGSGILLLVSLALLLFLAAGPVAHTALWGMGLLLALLNLGMFFDARTSQLPAITIVGVFVSWIVIGVWWAAAMEAALLLPALVIVAGFTVIIVGGNLWAGAATRKADGKPAFQPGLYLGLVGHVFLFYVATQAAFAVPPWPLLGVLLVLDLAILAASLYANRGELHGAALGASQLVVLAFLFTAGNQAAAALPWAVVALLASSSFALLGLASIALARRRGADSPFFFYGAVLTLFLGQLIVVAAGVSRGVPGVGWLAVISTCFFGALLGLGSSRKRYVVSLVALALPALGVVAWEGEYLQRARWTEALALAAGPYLLASLYPVFLGARARTERTPYLVTVLASAPFFWATRVAMRVAGHDDVIGILPVGQALVLSGVLVFVLRLETQTRTPRDRGRLALVAGAALAFLTLAIPLQLDKQWITLGWALEAAALAWLHRKLSHRGLLVGSFGLVVSVVARLSFNPSVFEYHARTGTRIWNWYLYAYLLAAGALFVTAWFLRGSDDRPFAKLPRVSQLAAAGGTLLLFLLLNIEIADWFSTGSEVTFNFSSSTLAQDLTYTLGWAVFAVALLAAGVAVRGKGTRIAALVLLVVTIVKCFFHDLARLDGLYRIGSFVALAFCLALVAIVLQKFVLMPDAPAAPAPRDA